MRKTRQNNETSFFKKLATQLQVQAFTNSKRYKTYKLKERNQGQIKNIQSDLNTLTAQNQSKNAKMTTTFYQKNNMHVALPLIKETPVENETNKEKFITIELKCKAGASTASTGSYKKHIRIFKNGTPQEFINVRMAIQEVWNQNGISTPTDKVNIIRMVIKGESFTIFQAKISKLTADGTSLNSEHIVEGLNTIAINAFPHRALFYQKRWMQNGIKKPRALTTRQTIAALTRINNSLPMFPGATQEDKFNKMELLQIMEWMIPTEF